MTLSSDARRQNFDGALVSFLDALGDRLFCTFYISPSDYPNVLATTWTELTSRGLLNHLDWNIEMYQLTPLGYVTALKISGRADDPEFREKLGRLCKVLKGSLKDRTDFAFVAFHDVVKESGLSEDFARNALDADLIGRILGRTGAMWEGEHIVRVPNNFGLTPL
jgi:hypothetical protein